MPAKKSFFTKALVVFLFLVMMPCLGRSQVSWRMSYYGYLDEEPGKPMSRKVTLTFSLYDVIQGGDPLWTEVHEGVDVKKGFYKVTLGSINTLVLPCDKKYFVGVKVGKGFSAVTSGLLDKLGDEDRQEWRDMLVVPLEECAPSTAESQNPSVLAPIVSAVESGGGGPTSGRQKKAAPADTGRDAERGASTGGSLDSYMENVESALSDVFSGVEDIGVRRVDNALAVNFQSEVLFEGKSSKFKRSGDEKFTLLTEVLNRYPRTNIRVDVHTDSVGTYEYCKDLAERQARSIEKALILRKINPKRMTVVGVGEVEPIADDGFEWGRRLNRRVKVTISPE